MLRMMFFSEGVSGSSRTAVVGDDLICELLLEMDCEWLRGAPLDGEWTLEGTRLLDVGKLENTMALEVLMLHIPTEEKGTVGRIILLEEDCILDRTLPDDVDILESDMLFDGTEASAVVVLLVDTCMLDSLMSDPGTLDRMILLEGATLEMTMLLGEMGTFDRIMSLEETGTPIMCCTS